MVVGSPEHDAEFGHRDIGKLTEDCAINRGRDQVRVTVKLGDAVRAIVSPPIDGDVKYVSVIIEE